jgi:hypothetical protein
MPVVRDGRSQPPTKPVNFGIATRDAMQRSLDAERAAAGLPPEADTTVTPEEVEERTKEKAGLMADAEAARLILAQRNKRKQAEPLAPPTRVVRSEDASFVKARVAEARAGVDAATADARAAEEATKVEHEKVIADARARLMEAEREERTMLGDLQIGQLHDRVARVAQAGAGNYSREANVVVERRQSFERAVAPLIAKSKIMLAEMEAFYQEHAPMLTKLSQTRWETVDNRWKLADRQAFADRAALPATEILNSIQSVVNNGPKIIDMVESAIAGRIEHNGNMIERLRILSQHYVGHFVSLMNVMNVNLARIEARATRGVKEDVVPEVRMRVPNPAHNPTPRPQVITGYDVFGDKK